jgi:hypothetical protein
MNLIKEVSTAMILRQLSSPPVGGLQIKSGAHQIRAWIRFVTNRPGSVSLCADMHSGLRCSLHARHQRARLRCQARMALDELQESSFPAGFFP